MVTEKSKEIGERIRTFRTTEPTKMSQTAFGAALSMSRDAINNLENGRAEVTGAIIQLICSKFSISRQWLETGIGPMKLQATEDEELIDEWLSECSDFQKACLLGVIRTPGGWEKLEEIVKNIQQILDEKKAQGE